jgi:hypothetical protein
MVSYCTHCTVCGSSMCIRLGDAKDVLHMVMMYILKGCTEPQPSSPFTFTFYLYFSVKWALLPYTYKHNICVARMAQLCVM